MKRLIGFLVFFISTSILGVPNSSKTDNTDNNDKKKDKNAEYEMNVVQKNTKEFKDNRVIEVVSEKEIKQIDKGNIKSILEDSGLNLQQTGAGQLSPFLRGMTGQHTLLIFDGIRLNNAIFRYGPNQYSAILDSNIIGKIEILKGASPTLYGSDAVGGVIAFSSEKLNNRLNFFGRYESASESMGLHTDVANKMGGLNFNLQASMNNYKNIEGGEGVGKQDFTSYQNKSVTAKFNYKLSDKLGDLTFLATYFSQTNGYRTDKSKPEDYRIYPKQNHGIYYIKYRNYLNDINTSLNVTGSFQKTYEEYKRFKHDNMSDHRIDDLYQYELSIRARSKFDDLTVYSGFEDTIEYLRSDKNYADKSEYNTVSLFTKGEYKFNDLLGGLGARYTFVYTKGIENFSYSKNNISFSAFLEYNLNNYYNISLNYAEGFRAPNLNDLTGSFEFNGGYEFGNEDLGAETSHMFELVNKFQYDNFFLSLSGYYTILKGFIGRKEIDKPAGYEEYDQVVKKENVNDGYIYGFEVSSLYKYKKMLEFKFNINYVLGMMDEIVDKKTLETELHPMRRIPPLQGIFKLTYNHNSDISLFYKALFATKQDRLSDGDIKDKRIPEGGTPGYFVTNLGANFKLYKFNLMLVIENITNEKYKYHGSGVYESGRNYFVKFGGNF